MVDMVKQGNGVAIVVGCASSAEAGKQAIAGDGAEQHCPRVLVKDLKMQVDPLDDLSVAHSGLGVGRVATAKVINAFDAQPGNDGDGGKTGKGLLDRIDSGLLAAARMEVNVTGRFGFMEAVLNGWRQLGQIAEGLRNGKG